MGKKPTWSDDELIEAVRVCRSFNDVSLYIGISKSSNSLLKKRAIQLNLDFSHFKGSGHTPIPLNELLVYGRHNINSTHTLKKRLIKENVKEPKCEWCELTTWRGQQIPLELDHIDGDRMNNCLENLRILCPNCHAQTSTYRARNIKKKGKENGNTGKMWINNGKYGKLIDKDQKIPEGFVKGFLSRKLPIPRRPTNI